MAKLLIKLSILLTLAIIGSNAFTLTRRNVEVEVVTSDKIQDILKQYPNAVKVTHEMLEKRSKREIAEEKRNIKITLGKRIDGDLEVGKDSGSFSWDKPQSYQTTISYPLSDDSKTLSCVQLNIALSNLNHNLYIVSGGIGERHIKLMLDASSTDILEYDVNFYGY